MNLTKLIRQFIFGAIAFIAGAGCMYWWGIYQTRQDKALLAELAETPSIWVRDMQGATVSPDVKDVAEKTPVRANTVPSQLSKIEVPEVQTVVLNSGTELNPNTGEMTAPSATLPVLDDNSRVAVGTVIQVPTASSTQAISVDTKMSLIEAPVKAVLIKTLEQYRDFKRRARGNYPEVNFANESVLVLESTSNLPDKVFEIQTISDENGKRLVTYRVSVFGLDKKTNTHSVAVVDKSAFPLELKQVL